LVIDFAPHEMEFLRTEFAHHRLGFPPEAVIQWMEQAGLEGAIHTSVAPQPGTEGKIAVSLWLAHDPRFLIANRREVA
jgi:hypothetical protein